MPLTQSQLDTIHYSIDHMLDFPEDVLEFQKAEKELMEALTQAVNKENNFYWLNECLKNPTAHFQQLENQKSGTEVNTVGEIQDAIIAYTFKKLSERGHPLSIWNENQIRSSLAPDQATAFKSKKAQIDGGDSIWALRKTSDKIYSQELRIIEEERNISGNLFHPVFLNQKVLCVEVCLEINGAKLTTQVKDVPSHLRSDRDDDVFIANSLDMVEEEAKKTAAHLAINYLQEKYNLSSYQANRAQISRSTHDLIIHKYWFDLLNQGSIQLEQLCKLQPDEVKKLIHPVCIALLKENFLDFYTAKRLNAAELQVMGHYVYSPLIKNGSISTADVKGISSKRAAFLINPRLTRLIQLNQITFVQARNLYRHLQEIVLSSAYETYFATHTTNWDLFNKIKESHSTVLFDKNIIRLLSNNVINFHDIVSTMNQYNTANEALYHIIINSFTKRLYSFCYHNPISINGITDTIDIVKAEITSTANDFHTAEGRFNEWIFFELAKHLEKDIKKQILESPKGGEDFNTCNKMMKILCVVDSQSNTPWADAFSTLMNLVNETSELIRQQERVQKFANRDAFEFPGYTVFPPPSNKRKNAPVNVGMKNLCEKISSLDELCNGMEVQVNYRI